MATEHPTTNENSDTGADRRQYVQYLAVLLIVPALLYFPPFILVRLPSYEDFSGVFDLPVLDFAFKAAGKNADVVIFGDSSANHGIDPGQMTVALGAKVLDLPSNLSGLLIVDAFPLQHYLTLDRPPKLIVLYLAAWDMDFHSLDIESNSPYNGLEMLLRYGDLSRIWSFAKLEPSLVLRFPLMFYRANLNLARILHPDNLRREALQLAETNGHADSIGSDLLGRDCRIPADLVARIHFDTVRRLAASLTNASTKVMIYVAPIPACTNSREVISAVEKEITVEPPKVMPPHLFLKDQYYTHLVPTGVADATANLIDAVRPYFPR